MYLISIELANFLNCDIKEKKSWIDIIYPIYNYIITNNLECKHDKRLFKPDLKLQNLFKEYTNKFLLHCMISFYIRQHITKI